MHNFDGLSANYGILYKKFKRKGKTGIVGVIGVRKRKSSQTRVLRFSVPNTLVFPAGLRLGTH